MAKGSNDIQFYVLIGMLAIVMLVLIIAMIYWISKRKKSTDDDEDPPPPPPPPPGPPKPKPDPKPDPDPKPKPDPKPDPDPKPKPPPPTSQGDFAPGNVKCFDGVKNDLFIADKRLPQSDCDNLGKEIKSNTDSSGADPEDVKIFCPNGTIQDMKKFAYNRNCEPNVGVMFFKDKNYDGRMFASSYKFDGNAIINTPDWISSIILKGISIQAYTKADGKGNSGIFTEGHPNLKNIKKASGGGDWNDAIRSFKFIPR